MTEPVYLQMDRDEVISYMTGCWPPVPGAPCLHLAEPSEVIDGAVVVYPVEGRPGTTWWVLDTTVYRQDAGVPDEALAALLPGSVLTTVLDPNPPPDTPPYES